MKKVIIIVVVLLLLIGAHFVLVHKTVTDWNGYSIVELIAKPYCDIIGRKMILTGCGLAGCTSSCQKVYRDGGERCMTSADCKGKCEIVNGHLVSDQLRINKQIDNCEKVGDNIYECTSPLSSLCQDEPLSNCGSLWERNDSTIQYHWADCTM
jgi:hypothetical protein